MGEVTMSIVDEPQPSGEIPELPVEVVEELRLRAQTSDFAFATQLFEQWTR